MSTFVLVHGAWHGAWCWYKIIPALERAGHTVIAPDLAGLGMDKTAATQITLQRWVSDVGAVLDRQSEPVILVGHSRGGIVISQVAQARPQQIRVLVYLTAFLVPSGKTLLDITQHDSVAQQIMRFDVEQQSVSLDPGAVQSVFYGDCSEQDVALARLLLAPEPAAPLATALQLTDDGFGRVPRVYIECARDQAIAPDLQRRMHAALPCRAVLSIDSDHSPFLSRPDELVQRLLSIVDGDAIGPSASP
jgi:pimeloyl-ACP methyl ester carboxylesterase